MARSRGNTAQWLRNVRRSPLPLLERAAVTARNLRARLGPPPQDCCGHPGEPGC